MSASIHAPAEATSSPPAAQGTFEVLGACPHDCPDTCSLVTSVQDGVAIKVHGNPNHSHTGGVLCTKVSRYTERSYHPERLQTPLRRTGPKGSGQYEEVSWDEALADIASRLKDIASRNPEAILPYSYAGTMGLVQGESMAARFFHKLGASLLDRTICASAGAAALEYTLGGKVGTQDGVLCRVRTDHDLGQQRHWQQPAFLAPCANRQAQRRQNHLHRSRASTETAEKCHVHIALLPRHRRRPGPLGMMHELIQHDWLDHDYLAQHTLGWDALRERALQWPPARAAEVCGITAGGNPKAWRATTAKPARQCKSAAIRLNYGMQRARGGGNAVRAMACLPALTGAWRQTRAGGMLLSNSGVCHRPTATPCSGPTCWAHAVRAPST